MQKELYIKKLYECKFKARPFIFESEEDREYFNKIGFLTMNQRVKKNARDKAALNAEISAVAAKMKMDSFSVRWPKELNDFLDEKIGHLFYTESPPVEIVGGIDFVIDMYMPSRITKAIMATQYLLKALVYYIKNDLGPIPEEWVRKGDSFFVPAPDILRFKLKTFNPHEGIAKGEKVSWSPKSTAAPNLFEKNATSLLTAIGIYDEPGICYFLYGGVSNPNFVDLSVSLAYLKRICGGVHTGGRSNDPRKFFRLLQRRFPNYSGVLMEMGWGASEIPLTPGDLPEKMYEMYLRAELLEHQDIKERMYKLSKMSGNVSQMSAIIRSLDEDTLLKKDNAKSKKASGKSGLKNASPNWL